MPITFTCPACLAPIKAADGLAGFQARCPHCKARVSVPRGTTPLDEPSRPAALPQPQTPTPTPTQPQPCPKCGQPALHGRCLAYDLEKEPAAPPAPQPAKAT